MAVLLPQAWILICSEVHGRIHSISPQIGLERWRGIESQVSFEGTDLETSRSKVQITD